LVSILMSSYNHASYLRLAIESALAQTDECVEVIICDDGSTDDSRSILRRYASDPRVTVIEKPNGGQASGLNRAYAECRGDVVCLLDADDIVARTKAGTAVSELRGEAGLFVHPLVHIDERGRILQDASATSQIERGWIGDKLLGRGGRWRPPPTSGICLRREIADHVFPIPESFRICADAFVVSLAPLLTPVATVARGLGSYRVHAANQHFRDRIDSRTVRQNLQLRRQIETEVNRRLEELGLCNIKIDISKDVSVHTSVFVLSLLDGVPLPSLVRQFWSLAHTVRDDDMLDPIAKVGHLLLHGLAIAVPVGLRSVWLSVGRNRMFLLKRYGPVGRRALAALRRISFRGLLAPRR
jgi:glycosyltransferase involved in cell wall biosynthesis